MNTTRPDLINSGIFIRDKSEATVPNRPAPTFLSDDRDAVLKTEIVVTGYGMDGNETTVESDMVAKCETGLAAMYWVRFSKSGSDKGCILNPRGLYFSESSFKSKRSRYEFRRVPREAFLLYVGFLKNHSDGVLREVERITSG